MVIGYFGTITISYDQRHIQSKVGIMGLRAEWNMLGQHDNTKGCNLYLDGVLRSVALMVSGLISLIGHSYIHISDY